MLGHVRPNVQRLTDADARRLLAKGINRLCVDHRIDRVALETGCDEKTIRRARDQHSTLGLACAVNLLDVDGHALDELLGAKGYGVQPLAVSAAVDAIVAQSATIHRIAAARDPNGPGGVVETDLELVGMETEVDAALAALTAMKGRIVAAKVRLAA